MGRYHKTVYFYGIKHKNNFKEAPLKETNQINSN